MKVLVTGALGLVGRATVAALRGVLRVTAFRRLWYSTALSSLGDWLGLLATTALATTLAHGYKAQNYALGGVLVVKLLPAIVLGPLAGVFADRFDRRITMVVSDVVRFVLFLSIPLAHLVVDEAQHAVELVAVRREQLVEVAHLLGRPRIAVEEEARRGVRLREAVGHELVGERVGDVVARVDDRLDAEAELGLVRDVRTEDVTRRDRRDAETLRDPRGLGALAGSGRADDEKPDRHRSSPS